MKKLFGRTAFFALIAGMLVCGALGVAACGSGHVHVYGAWSVEKEATCEEAGVRSRTCTDPRCPVEKERTQTEEIAPLGHEWGLWKIVTPATCTEGGTRIRTCNVCQKPEEEATSPLGHDWDAGDPIEKATCTQKGLSLFTCNVCGEAEERETDMLPHTWSAERTLEPTCEKAGEETRTCTVCHTVEKSAVAALGHVWVAGSVLSDPTCTEAGEREQTCSRCGNTRTAEIPALGHSPEGDYTIDVEPTFEHAGSKSYHCTRCGEKIGSVEIPALDENTPIEYEFRVLRNNGEKIGASLSIEVFDGAEKVAASSRSTLSGGVFRVQLLPKTYTVKVSGVPEGYTAAESYTVRPERPVCELYLTASPRTGTPGSSLLYRTGDVMYDFSAVTVNGETVTLSSLLAEKKMVLINFFYVGCPNCEVEFPGLEAAYRKYEKDVAVIAIDPRSANGDSEQTVRSYAGSRGFTFHTVWDDGVLDLHKKFGVTGYPFSVIVDGEGVIAWTKLGGMGENAEEAFGDLFEKYTADGYWKNQAKSAPTPARYEAVLPEKRTGSNVGGQS